MHSNIAVYLDKQGLDLSIYYLRVIIKTERKNFKFLYLSFEIEK